MRRRDSDAPALWPAAVIVTLALMNQPLKWPTDFPEEMFPTQMVHDHAALITDPNARVLTTDQWADYLIYIKSETKSVRRRPQRLLWT